MKIGRRDVLDIGGWGHLRADLGGDLGEDEVEETGLACGDGVWAGGGGMPDTTGAGRLRASVALRASCREKSLACHHSRNLSAKMDAGRRSFNERRNCGYRTCGPNQLRPGRPARPVVLGGFVTIAMAL